MLKPFGDEFEKETQGNVRVRVKGLRDFHFVNVDLEVASARSIKPLLDEIGESVFAFFPGGEIGDGKQANLEIMVFKRKRKWIYQSFDDEKNLIGGADVLISAFCYLIENLSPKSRQIWNNCRRKEFDIGFEGGNTKKSYRTLIRAETIKRCGEIGASISITIYPIN